MWQEMLARNAGLNVGHFTINAFILKDKGRKGGKKGGQCYEGMLKVGYNLIKKKVGDSYSSGSVLEKTSYFTFLPNFDTVCRFSHFYSNCMKLTGYTLQVCF